MQEPQDNDALRDLALRVASPDSRLARDLSNTSNRIVLSLEMKDEDNKGRRYALNVEDGLTGETEHVIIPPEILGEERFISLALGARDRYFANREVAPVSGPGLLTNVWRSGTFREVRAATRRFAVGAMYAGLTLYGALNGVSILAQSADFQWMAESRRAHGEKYDDTVNFNVAGDDIEGLERVIEDGRITLQEVQGEAFAHFSDPAPTGQERRAIHPDDYFHQQVGDFKRRATSTMMENRHRIGRLIDAKESLASIEYDVADSDERGRINGAIYSLNMEIRNLEPQLNEISVSSVEGGRFTETVHGYRSFHNELKENGYRDQLVDAGIRRYYSSTTIWGAGMWAGGCVGLAAAIAFVGVPIIVGKGIKKVLTCKSGS